jgi:hypothetical protein
MRIWGSPGNILALAGSCPVLCEAYLFAEPALARQLLDGDPNPVSFWKCTSEHELYAPTPSVRTMPDAGAIQ